MKDATKYVIYLLAVLAVILFLFYMRDNISIWLSRVGTYAVMFAFTFFAGWLMGRMGMKARCREKMADMQRRIDELER